MALTTPVSAPMQLDIDTCQNSDCSSLNITDQTGVYSSGNSGGYGSPNFAISDAVGAHLYVTDPSGVQTTINCYPTFPDDTGASTFTITNTDLGNTGSMADGIYVIKYQVDFLNFNSQVVSYNVVKTILLSCSTKCCIDKMIAKIPESDCSCEDKQLKNALLAFGLYQALINAGKCGSVSAVSNLLSRLTKLCSSANCGCS